jgi:hypothetical protein
LNPTLSATLEISVVLVRSRRATLRAILPELCKDQLSPFVSKGENACQYHCGLPTLEISPKWGDSGRKLDAILENLLVCGEVPGDQSLRFASQGPGKALIVFACAKGGQAEPARASEPNAGVQNDERPVVRTIKSDEDYGV